VVDIPHKTLYLRYANSLRRKSNELDSPSPDSATYDMCDLGPLTTPLSFSFLICNLGTVREELVPITGGSCED
jgi:hypothetical protein